MNIQKILYNVNKADSLFKNSVIRSCLSKYSSATDCTATSQITNIVSSVDVSTNSSVSLDVEKGKWTSVRELFNNRVHLGHRIGSLDQRMTRYIWGQRLEHLIIDLDKTLVCLNKALEVTREIAKRQGIILFVTNSPSSSIQVENAAAQVGEYAHTRPWRQGTLTNSLMIFGAVTRLPDLIISIGSHQALLEAAKMSIPSIAIMDSDCNPNIVTYPIPGNDDTPSAVQLYLSLFTRAISIGKEQQKK